MHLPLYSDFHIHYLMSSKIILYSPHASLLKSASFQANLGQLNYHLLSDYGGDTKVSKLRLLLLKTSPLLLVKTKD